jgi:gliding motility-associated-like protein
MAYLPKIEKIVCIQEEEYLEDPIYNRPFPKRIKIGKEYDILDENLNYYILIDELGDSNAFKKELFQDVISYNREMKIENLLNQGSYKYENSLNKWIKNKINQLKMRKIFLLLFSLMNVSLFSQCAGNQSYTISPIMSEYPGGTQIQVCYTMSGWDGTISGSNWIEGFQISTSSGLLSLSPSTPPGNCDESSNGNWIWVPGTITSSNTGLVAGPGWFFEINQGGVVDGDPGNDWGDYGEFCDWTFCFQVTVIDTCVQMPISVSVTAGADGTWGSWGINSCPLVPFNIPIGQNDPMDFESIPSSSLIDSICVGESTIHSILDTTGLSVFDPSNPVVLSWNTVGTNQISIIEENIQGCKDTTYFTIHVLDLPSVDVLDVDPVCYRDNPIQLNSFPLGGIWSPSGPTFDPQSGTSWVYYTYQDQYGCRNNDSTQIVVHPNPNDLEIFGTDSFVNCLDINRINMYYVPYTPGSSYIWSLNGESVNYNIINSVYMEFPNISNHTNTISVYEVNEFGCVGFESSIPVYSERCGEVYIPNSFSPNGDNVNDRFRVYTNGQIEEFTMRVYDRWGQVVYTFGGQNDEWMADNIQNDVYVYRFSGMVASQWVNKIGHVTLIR